MTRALDMQFAAIVAWLQAPGLEAATDLLGRTTIRARRPKRSRLDGRVR